jgi:nitrate reductase gamma subunit
MLSQSLMRIATAKAPSCHVLHFDISQTAGYYSVLTGLLAGFAFTTLILLLTNRLEHKVDAEVSADRLANTQQVLAAAFVGLILMSLSYAVAAGETNSSGRSASEEPILGLGFALSGLLVIYSIVLTLDAVYASAPKVITTGATESAEPKAHSSVMHPGSAVALFLRDLLGRFVTFIASLYVYLGITDYETIRYWKSSAVLHPLDILALLLLAAQAVAGIVYYPRWTSARHDEASDYRTARSRSSVITLSRGSLAVTFLCAIVFAIYDGRASLCTTASPIIPTTCFVIMGLSALAFTYQLASSRPSAMQVRSTRQWLAYLVLLVKRAPHALRWLDRTLLRPGKSVERTDSAMSPPNV